MLLNLLFLFNCNSVVAQEKKNWVTVSSNPIRAIFNEYFIQFDYKLNPKTACGISLGIVHPNEQFDVFPLSPSQNDFPGLVYDGVAFRTNFSYSLIHLDYYEFYVSPQFIYKRLWYNNQEFWDSWGDPGNNWYTRDEKTNLFGGDLLIGWNFFPGRVAWPVEPFINLHCGIGMRYRKRAIVNTESRVEGIPKVIVKVGEETKEQIYFIPLNGIRFGFRINLTYFHKLSNSK